MLTPRFKLSQDDNHVFICVHAPYTNVRDTEIDVDGDNFLFLSSPYFLRLQLPGKIVDQSNNSVGTYTCDSGDFNLTFDKEVPGEYFENLDMITCLIAPRDIPSVNPDLVEMLDDNGITFDNSDDSDSGDKYSYGFANKVTTEFQDIGTEFPQIFELRYPERVSIAERNKIRIDYEDRKFSSDHYLADYFDEELIAPYLSSSPNWTNLDINSIEFTDAEVGVLKELPNKNYLLSKNEYKQVLYGLIDILYGYCYDKRTTLNESTVESSWTINKLSSTLSWFCAFNNVQETLISCYRRALIYPIFRNFELCEKVKNDVVILFRKGKKFVIKCVIEIYKMFTTSNDARYILNQLYIQDYLIFLQKCHTDEIDELCNNIANTEISKPDLNLDLEEFEMAGRLVQQDELEIMENQMALQLASMSLLPKRNRIIEQTDSDSDSSSDSSDSSSDSSDSSSDSSDDSSEELDSDDDPL